MNTLCQSAKLHLQYYTQQIAQNGISFFFSRKIGCPVHEKVQVGVRSVLVGFLHTYVMYGTGGNTNVNNKAANLVWYLSVRNKLPNSGFTNQCKHYY